MRRKRRNQAERAEWLQSTFDPAYFLDTHGWVYDATSLAWIRFRLWPEQVRVVRALRDEQLVIVLKARQLGLSWLAVGFGLWLMLFRPAATVLLFSKRDDEAVHLLSFRLKGMYQRLPAWLQCQGVGRDNDHELRLSNGSAALAFPTTGGRSYTASLAIVDEADFAPDLDLLLNAVKPTIDAGGRFLLLSTADKSRPESAFKRIWRAAAQGENDWRPVFLPWSARPGRTAEWYAAQERDVLARTGSRDDLYQEYPATELEALAARSLDKRFAAEWLSACDGTNLTPQPSSLKGAAQSLRGKGDDCEQSERGPALPGFVLYGSPETGRDYVIGCDPAEGNPQSDESAASVVEALTGEQVAVLAGRFEPAVFAGYVATLSEYFNGAAALVERNNHGHAVLLWLAEFSQVACLRGLDGKPGWLESGRSKPWPWMRRRMPSAIGRR